MCLCKIFFTNFNVFTLIALLNHEEFIGETTL
jgi:hypothetical protein